MPIHYSSTIIVLSTIEYNEPGNSNTEVKWRDLVETYRGYVPQASDKNWKANYYRTAKELKTSKVPPVLNQAEQLMDKKKKPNTGKELMMQALEPWEHGSRARQISRRVLKAFLEWAVLEGNLPTAYSPPPLAAFPDIRKKKKVGYALSDLQVISLISS